MTKGFNGFLRAESSELTGCYWKVKGNVLLNVALSVGVFVECKLGVMYVGKRETLFMSFCMSPEEINI